MRKIEKYYMIISLIVLYGIGGCNKDKPFILPSKANFAVGGDTSQSPIIFAKSQFDLDNNSVNADSYLWDLGNGKTSTQKAPKIYFENSGSYTVSLTTLNRTGGKSMVSKTIKVISPVLKRVIINKLNWEPIIGVGGSYIKSNKANVWIEIQQGDPNEVNYSVDSNGLFKMPTVYKSSVAVQVDSTALPIEFSVPSKIIFDYSAIANCCGYIGRGFVVNLFAQDETGTYLVFSTNWSGVGYIFNWDIDKNSFEILSSRGGNGVQVKGDFE